MLAIAAGVTLLGGAVGARQQQPTFRSAVDVIEFDVRVVTGKGIPVLGLGADKFDVTIDGAHRRVVSAEVVQYGRNVPASVAPNRLASTAVWPDAKTLRQGSADTRTFVLVIDASSFDMTSSIGVIRAARTFVQGLQPGDVVGLFVFPTGSQISPTTDRGKILNALLRVTGEPSPEPTSRFNLRPTELVALSPMLNDRTDRDSQLLIDQLCGEDVPCQKQLRVEVQALVNNYEQRAMQSLAMLRSLILNLAAIQGRKTLLMISGGVVTSNRPGGRPDIGNIDILIGQEAVRTNTSIYTLYVDWRFKQQSSAEQRRPRNTLTGLAEDSELLMRPLAQFTGSAGGALFTALSDEGVAAFNQILNETSAYYVLGVLPAESDRDGRARQLSVKVKQPGATVRGSRWVTVPKR
ncbi:MAG: VWA domain-containing protein [Vicinamibacterales bacterium]